MVLVLELWAEKVHILLLVGIYSVTQEQDTAHAQKTWKSLRGEQLGMVKERLLFRKIHIPFAIGVDDV